MSHFFFENKTRFKNMSSTIMVAENYLIGDHLRVTMDDSLFAKY